MSPEDGDTPHNFHRSPLTYPMRTAHGLIFRGGQVQPESPSFQADQKQAHPARRVSDWRDAKSR